MEFVEFILVGLTLFAVMVGAMQYHSAIKKREHILIKDSGVNPFDYLTKPMPEGTFSANQPFKKVYAWVGGVMCLMGFGWMAVNIPTEYKTFVLSVIYGVASVVVMVVVLIEEVAPYKSEITGVMLLGYGEWDKQIEYGIAMSIPFILVSSLMKVYGIAVKPFQVVGMPVASFILVAIMIPLVEEGLFRGVLAASIAEDAGVIHGALISAFVFAMFHAYAYSTNPVYMATAFAFGIVAALVDFRFKSTLPGTIAHSLTNMTAFISTALTP